jgi:hypothetical protein
MSTAAERWQRELVREYAKLAKERDPGKTAKIQKKIADLQRKIAAAQRRGRG